LTSLFGFEERYKSGINARSGSVCGHGGHDLARCLPVANGRQAPRPHIIIKNGGFLMKVSCLSAFDDKAMMPDDDMVSAALGSAAPIWDELRAHVEGSYPGVTGEWKHYGKAAGWTYKLISKKRNLLFFVPMADCFRLRVVLGEKACVCAEADNELPHEIKEAVRAATPYAEGRSIDFDINRREQLVAIKRLLKIKYEN